MDKSGALLTMFWRFVGRVKQSMLMEKTDWLLRSKWELLLKGMSKHRNREGQAASLQRGRGHTKHVVTHKSLEKRRDAYAKPQARAQAGQTLLLLRICRGSLLKVFATWGPVRTMRNWQLKVFALERL